MAEFRFWIAEYYNDWSCHNGEKKYRFLSRDKAIERAKEMALSIPVSLRRDVEKQIHMVLWQRDENRRTHEVQFGKPEIQEKPAGDKPLGAVTVMARYPVTVFDVLREKVLVQKEIKEPGQPYQPPVYEERCDSRECGLLYFCEQTRYTDLRVAFGGDPGEPYTRYVQYFEECKVYVGEEVIRTED